MEGLVIRRPRAEEKEIINEFFATVLRHTFDRNNLMHLVDLLEEEFVDKRRILDEDFRSNGRQRFFLIASLDGEVVGSIEYGPCNELLNKCTDNAFSHLMEIGTVFVHPSYQRKGIGNTLLKAMFKEMHKEGHEEVCFDSGYPSAQKVWVSKFGTPEYFLEDYWGEGAHHMVWRLNIAEQVD